MTARSMRIKAGYGEKQTARVITVDKARRRIECALKDGGHAYVAIFEIPVAFRWPKTGEVIVIRRDSGIWRLEGLFENRNHLQDAITLQQLGEGEVRVLAESSTEGSGLIINRFHASRQTSVNLGDGAEDFFEFEHGLGTEDVDITLKENSTGQKVDADIEIVDEDTISIEFGIPPTTNQYRVTVTG